jgi:beta-barrel assembly-enhancing protease
MNAHLRHALASLGLASLSCGAQAQPVAPIVNASDARPIHEEEDRVWAESRRAVEALESSARPQTLELLQRVVRRLSPLLESKMVFKVLTSPNPNAMMFPSGASYITTGMLALMQNEDELAFVLAHEIAHFRQRHSYIHRNQRNTAMGLGSFIGLGLPILAHYIALSSVYGFSRDHEREADAMSWDTMVQGGYNPRAGVAILQSLLDHNTDVKPLQKSHFASHPEMVERLETWNQRIARDNPAEFSSTKDRSVFLSETQALRQRGLTEILKAQRPLPIIRLLEPDDSATRERFSGVSLAMLAQAYLQRNENEDSAKARAALERALANKPDDVYALRVLGEIELRAKNLAVARTHFEKFLAVERIDQDQIAIVKEYLKWTEQ